MKLHASAFERIKAGSKRVEVRLFDRKRAQLTIGDTIVFAKSPELKETITVEVVSLQRFASFADMLKTVSLNQLGRPELTEREYIERMHSIYSAEEEKELGILAIEITLVS